MAKRPLLKEWGPLLECSDGIEKCVEDLRELAAFLADEEAKKLYVNERYRLGGKVYGRAKFENGDEIKTSRVTTIERVENVENVENNGDDNAPYGLMLATTEGGSVYCIFNGIEDCKFHITGDIRHLDPH